MVTAAGQAVSQELLMASNWGVPVIAWPDRLRPNLWDLLAVPLVFGGIALLAWGAARMSVPYEVGEALPISLDPANLPSYALRTVLRMFAALAVSLVFSLAYAAAAAKNRHLEKVLIPLLDILQSVPILGFLSVTVTGFIALFPGRLAGVECAAIFAIFTSQAWNMTFSLYQSFRTVPIELSEAARMYHLGAWARFWRLEVPHAMPGLVWNMMMSISGGWFFVVASEAITVSGQTIALPGVGSYIATAIDERNLTAILYAVLAMLVVILIYDQLLFRPLLVWAQRFKNENLADDELERPWFLILIQRARLFDLLRRAALWLRGNAQRGLDRMSVPRQAAPRRWTAAPWGGRAVDLGLAVLAIAIALWLTRFVLVGVGLDEVGEVFLLGFVTALRVLILILLASLIWVPIGVWIGLRPKIARRAQPIVQFLAAFPANLFFPVAVVLIIRFQLNVEIWVSPLMILGTQWYILFNVIAGAASIPNDLHYAARNLGVSRLLWWRRIILPAIFPAYITGALTAAGGSWNASIVSEVVKWGDTTLVATGIGSYIARVTGEGDFPRVALGIAVLCLYVITLNRLFWRRLYDTAAERLRLD
jgi:NitT/TauT family transport system permease protein